MAKGRNLACCLALARQADYGKPLMGDKKDMTCARENAAFGLRFLMSFAALSHHIGHVCELIAQ